MCWSNATLFYGLRVTTASLNFAATAHKATKSTTLAVDLITSRRRRGKLEVKGQDEKTTARELPEEVWELVKHELLGVEIRQTELDRLDRLRCRSCEMREDGEFSWPCACAACQFKPEELERFQTSGHIWTQWGATPNCRTKTCLDNVANSGITSWRSVEQNAEVSKLLSNHGLVLATDEMWHADPRSFVRDFDSLSAIALPLHLNDDPSDAFATLWTEQAQNGAHGGGAMVSAIAHRSFRALIIPADADSRFARLVSKYSLRAVDRTKSTICPVALVKQGSAAPYQPAATGAKLNVDEGSAREGDQVPSLFAKDEPRWMLWSLAEPCRTDVKVEEACTLPIRTMLCRRRSSSEFQLSLESVLEGEGEDGK